MTPDQTRRMMERLAEIRDNQAQAIGSRRELRKRLPIDYKIPENATVEQIEAAAAQARKIRDDRAARLNAALEKLKQQYPKLAEGL